MELRDIEALASLARLHFEPDQLSAFAEEFKKTLAFVDQLSGLNTDGVPAQEGGVLTAFLRDDETGPTMRLEKALQNAPQTDGAGFLIPKVL
jgi:aspartyl-tRNA(Asn)/glutamyl-tRNA(Gln) amidotransferase subunit C